MVIEPTTRAADLTVDRKWINHGITFPVAALVVSMPGQILGYINPWLTLQGPGTSRTVAREVLDVLMGLLLVSNRVSQANR